MGCKDEIKRRKCMKVTCKENGGCVGSEWKERLRNGSNWNILDTHKILPKKKFNKCYIKKKTKKHEID